MFQGILKIVRCGHTMCKRCVKDCIKTVELTREQDNLTIARCNDSTCSEFFILPMCGAFENENEIEEVKQFSQKCNQLSHEILQFDIINEYLIKL